MHRATAIATALTRALADRRLLASGTLQCVVADWCAREEASVRQLQGVYAGVEGSAEWAADLLRYVRHRNSTMWSLSTGADMTGALPEAPKEERPILRRWAGPFNAREMLADLPAPARKTILAATRENKINLAILLQYALRIDGSRGRERIIRDTSLSLRRPISPAISSVLFSALVDSGWAAQA
jgi:hypothetical protein